MHLGDFLVGDHTFHRLWFKWFCTTCYRLSGLSCLPAQWDKAPTLHLVNSRHKRHRNLLIRHNLNCSVCLCVVWVPSPRCPQFFSLRCTVLYLGWVLVGSSCVLNPLVFLLSLSCCSTKCLGNGWIMDIPLRLTSDQSDSVQIGCLCSSLLSWSISENKLKLPWVCIWVGNIILSIQAKSKQLAIKAYHQLHNNRTCLRVSWLSQRRTQHLPLKPSSCSESSFYLKCFCFFWWWGQEAGRQLVMTVFVMEPVQLFKGLFAVLHLNLKEVHKQIKVVI